MKEERQRIAYMRFETEPGYQSQVDFGEFQFDRADGANGKRNNRQEAGHGCRQAKG